ncbi:MAG TPA: NAD(P)H-quinone oxidoreductase [Vicinamibacterales bacterium]|nr:NAD(P)H-quinone oxidoreductase [Vicinamibacterales bacterium]
MLAIEISQPGGPEVLQPVERPLPELHAGDRHDLLIRVEAAGVNRPDIMQREGKYPPPPGASDVPGLEVAGTVMEAAAGSRWHSGDRVCALVAGGGYAEYCAAPAAQCLPIPSGMDAVTAAAIPETYFTVWTNLFQRGHLGAGERVLIHGGTSGIGSTAIQLARAFGATAYATAGTDEKCEACRTLGAAEAINYRTHDFVEAIGELTRGGGVDVVLDIIGGEYLRRNIACLRLHGRLVQVGLIGGSTSQIDLRPILQNRLTVTGSTLRPRTVEEKGSIARELEEKVWPLLARGDVRPIVHATFPLRQAAEAHRLLESGEVVGKVVLTVAA